MFTKRIAGLGAAFLMCGMIAIVPLGWPGAGATPAGTGWNATPAGSGWNATPAGSGWNAIPAGNNWE
ncbi:hypothetical protein FPZ12_032455 [Amycolatopsis acidicola]|uniref:Uncharacterized protein n=1 Tax=Amycolatopsis acidicola TaxID=2596893 RepID=A0A5N0UVY3_9PSEU|nr:hypothetical protein [Amycolatopsis acidicola]KAA9154317.1 hypothetical protein FPZ12_032455 [Amycolatopsis acidicola]